jgi:hypothetical protein
MLPLRHKEEYFVKNQNIVLGSNGWSYVWRMSVGRKLEIRVKYGDVS